MNSTFPIFLIFVAFFFVAFIAIVIGAAKQQNAKLQTFWARLVPVVNGQIEKKTLRGRYENSEVEANVQINNSEDGDTSYRFELALKNCVGKSNWTMAFGSELLGQGEWKWRIKSRNLAVSQELERRGAVEIVTNALPQISAQTPEAMVEEARLMILNRANARRATGLPNENDATDSPWSSTKATEQSAPPQIVVSSQGAPTSLIINEKTMPFLANISRWATYPKFEFDARKGCVILHATVSEARGVSPEQFQAQLEFLVQLAKLNRECNV